MNDAIVTMILWPTSAHRVSRDLSADSTSKVDSLEREERSEILPKQTFWYLRAINYDFLTWIWFDLFFSFSTTGLSKDEAMAAYVELVEQLKAKS